MTTTIEKQFVHDTYQKIAQDFSTTRAYLWNSVKIFLNDVEPFSTIVEIGSGNGKNVLYRTDCVNLAFDLCENFTIISQDKGIDSVISNNLHIPLLNECADYVLSVAVIHHLSNHERRREAILELVRILTIGGRLLIQVWAMEQPENSRRKFTQQDNFVEFNNPQNTQSEYRFYHVFKEGELEDMIKNIPNVTIISSYWEIGNWVMIIEKSM